MWICAGWYKACTPHSEALPSPVSFRYLAIPDPGSAVPFLQGSISYHARNSNGIHRSNDHSAPHRYDPECDVLDGSTHAGRHLRFEQHPIVEFAHRLEEQGNSVEDAVITSCRVRLRPILMTSLATIIGMVPMALKLGTGSEQYAPLARAIIGGLSVSVLLGIYRACSVFAGLWKT